MISQTVRNECVRFGRHVDIQVSYKILQLEVLKDNPILDFSFFSIGADLRLFSPKTPLGL
jgi:hypothetical protein